MNKAALLTMARKFQADDDLYLVSIFDLEPSGIIVHAYNQINSKEYVLPVSEMEVHCISLSSVYDCFSSSHIIILDHISSTESSYQS